MYSVSFVVKFVIFSKAKPLRSTRNSIPCHLSVTIRRRKPYTIPVQKKCKSQFSCENEFYLHENKKKIISMALHLASLWNRGWGRLGSRYWWGLICLLHCSAHSNLRVVFRSYLFRSKDSQKSFLTLNSQEYLKLKYLSCNRWHNRWALYPWVTSENYSLLREQNNSHPSPLSLFNVGVFIVFYRYLVVNFVPQGSSNSRTALHGGDERRKALFCPFRVSKKAERSFRKKCLN